MQDKIIREFYLVNEYGKKFELLGDFNKTPFIYQPKGLGNEYDIETIPVINQQYVNTRVPKFNDITGTIICSSYVEYDILYEYLSFSKELKLYYKTVESFEDEYYLVAFKKLDKEEKEVDGLLMCEFALTRLSFLKKDKVSVQTNRVSSDNYPTFPLGVETPFILFTTGYNNVLYFTIYSTTSHLLPARIEVNGGYINPEWTNLTNGYEGGYSITSSNGELIIDSNFPQKMTEDGIDITQKQSRKGKENFLFLSPGKNEIEFRIAPPTASPTFTEIKILWSNERG